MKFQLSCRNARPTFWRAFLTAGFFALLALPSSAAAGVTSKTVTFISRALDRETTYIAFMPEPREPGKRYPTLYLLHGAWGSYRDWSEATSLTRELEGRPMIVITPDGSKFGWYVDAVTTRSNYETCISRDLVADVDSRFPTLRNRDSRGIAGLSMGGHGALSLAALHPDVFGSASAMSGILCLTNHPGKWHIAELLGNMPAALDEWTSHSVTGLVDRFTSGNVTLLFDTGTSDEANALEDNRRFDELLTNRSIAHTYKEFPGGHTWKYWRTHLPEHLDFHQRCFDVEVSGSLAIATMESTGTAITTSTP